MVRAKGKPTLPIEAKVRVVLSVLAGEGSMAEAARRHGVSQPTVANWRAPNDGLWTTAVRR